VNSSRGRVPCIRNGNHNIINRISRSHGNLVFKIRVIHLNGFNFFLKPFFKCSSEWHPLIFLLGTNGHLRNIKNLGFQELNQSTGTRLQDILRNSELLHIFGQGGIFNLIHLLTGCQHVRFETAGFFGLASNRHTEDIKGDFLGLVNVVKGNGSSL